MKGGCIYFYSLSFINTKYISIFGRDFYVMTKEQIAGLLEGVPSAVGVYYIYDKHDALIYVGKSIDIRNRLLQHFRSTDFKESDIRRQYMNDMERSIVHCDLDTFFVSVERLINSKLNGVPVLIGGSSDRGVVFMFL
jgi:hypothetical protein